MATLVRVALSISLAVSVAAVFMTVVTVVPVVSVVSEVAVVLVVPVVNRNRKQQSYGSSTISSTNNNRQLQWQR